MIVTILTTHRLPVVDPEPMPTGSDIVWASGNLIVKTTDPQWAKELVAERRALEITRGLPIATPRLVAHGELSGWPYVVMTRLPGRALSGVWPGLNTGERRALAAELGRVVRELHAVDAPAPTSWEPFLLGRLRDVGAPHREVHTEARWLDRIDAFMESVRLITRPLVFMHTEVLGEHVLVDRVEGDWRVTGLIDFADSRTGNPGYEIPALVEFIFKGEPGMLGTFLEAYGMFAEDLTPELGRELLAWGLIHQFGSLPRMLAAAGPPEPDGLEALAARLYDPRPFSGA